MITYKIRKPSQRLTSAPLIPSSRLKNKCEEINEECHGVYPKYELYKYDNTTLVAVYEVRVVTPTLFHNCSLPTLMKEVQL